MLVDFLSLSFKKHRIYLSICAAIAKTSSADLLLACVIPPLIYNEKLRRFQTLFWGHELAVKATKGKNYRGSQTKALVFEAIRREARSKFLKY